jgi:PTH1 family peptidyl-tRNA hydrolase
MNDSGIAVGRLTRYFKVPPRRILVLCDDIDIPFGTIRIRPEGSSGGNNGLKSIVQALGTQEFPRLRFGVGRPAHGAIDHVLGRFPPDQEELLPRLFGVADEAVESILSRGIRDAMNAFNRDWSELSTDGVSGSGSA